MPTAEALKERFKAGTIPLQSDFADLIDMANIGILATGQAATQNGPGAGLALDNSLLEVKAGAGIKVSEEGVSVDMAVVIPRGIITMFNGSTVPEGWALCNGENGTPNLIDHFILSGNTDDIGYQSEATLQGDKTGRYAAVDIQDATVEIKGSASATALTLEQIPEHSHTGGFRIQQEGWNAYGYIESWGTLPHYNGSYVEQGYLYKTSDAGGSQPHQHDVNLSSTHTHKATVVVPYYILAFIMKL